VPLLLARIEVDLPTVCSEICVGLARHGANQFTEGLFPETIRMHL